MDLSVWFYNKDLFTKAGPRSEQAADDPQGIRRGRARRSTSSAAEVNGTFFGGNCGGCEVFTWWPSIWADGQQVMSADGTSSTLASDEAKAVYAIYAG